MPVKMPPVKKITISLPDTLVEFADREAARQNISRSGVIAEALSRKKVEREEQLALEGYRFYAQEASEFAEASTAALAEVLKHDS